MKAVHFVVYEALVESASWWASVAAAKGADVEAAPQARAGKLELPRTAWIIQGVLMGPSACLAVPLTCIAVCVGCNYLYLFLEGSSLWS